MDLNVGCYIDFTFPNNLFDLKTLELIEGACIRWCQRHINLNKDLIAIIINLAFSQVEFRPAQNQKVYGRSEVNNYLELQNFLRGSKDYFIDWAKHDFTMKLTSAEIPIHINFYILPYRGGLLRTLDQAWGRNYKSTMLRIPEWQLEYKAHLYNYSYMLTRSTELPELN
ncbi:hypothetical protein [Manitoba virus]|uniref:Uncharacterized protein n=1 Tax=Manitoba virus TaxID=1272949 RepID=A0A0D3R175_9RHAB|nr:hypothetical protein [Manitoba virus]AJR28469.1 hypothetical protein [Manitoba virus]